MPVIGPRAAMTCSADYEFLEVLGGQVKQLVDGNLAHHWLGSTMPKIKPLTRELVNLPTLWRQFWADIHDKEVSSAATYSYLWTADQMGHVALGLLLGGLILEIDQGDPLRSTLSYR
jgi:hypothetical protein